MCYAFYKSVVGDAYGRVSEVLQDRDGSGGYTAAGGTGVSPVEIGCPFNSYVTLAPNLSSFDHLRSCGEDDEERKCE